MALITMIGENQWKDLGACWGRLGTEHPDKVHKVLLVESDHPTRTLWQHALSAAGYEVLCADNGWEALHLAASQADNLDLVVTEMVMSFFDGKDVAAAALQLNPLVKVLYTRAYPGEVSSVTAGFPEPEIMDKPFEVSSMLDRVHEILNT